MSRFSRLFRRRFTVLASSGEGKSFGNYVWYPAESALAIIASRCLSQATDASQVTLTRMCQVSVRIPDDRVMQLRFRPVCDGFLRVFKAEGQERTLQKRLACAAARNTDQTIRIAERRSDWVFVLNKGQEVGLTDISFAPLP